MAFYNQKEPKEHVNVLTSKQGIKVRLHKMVFFRNFERRLKWVF